ncbi:unnamed protein product [Chironomus riparius]|uniref:Uncharacterized protein n=1 Tax=Chironomus riparius TaxID=315576 RepID=A0A9N9WLI6_9DIPT|nr:unnamed protein product [Chironomus riparius]
MKTIIAITVIIILISAINCDEVKQENLRKFKIDLEFSEKIYKVAKEVEQSAKELFDKVQYEFEEFVVGINNLKTHLDSLLAELIKIDEAFSAAFQYKAKVNKTAALADEKFKEAKKNLDAVKTSEDREKIDIATKEYAAYSREKLLSEQALKKAEEALIKFGAELDDIKTAVKISQEAYDEALIQKQQKQSKLIKLKENFEAKINERIQAEKAYNKAKAAIELNPDLDASGLYDKRNGAASFGIKQIVGFFCSLLTGAVAAGLIM